MINIWFSKKGNGIIKLLVTANSKNEIKMKLSDFKNMLKPEQKLLIYKASK